MSDREYCEQLMKDLKASHVQLQKLLKQNSSYSAGFEIEQILKTDEADYINDGVPSLSVSPATREALISFHQKIRREDRLSTQFVERMPGIILVTGSFEAIKDTVGEINQFKTLIMGEVNRQKDRYQRHEFIHQVFPRIMTDQLRRKVHIIEEEVHNCWFNWVSRPIPETLCIDDAISNLEQAKDNIKGFYSPLEWKALIEANISELRSGRFEHVQRIKRLQCLPIMTYQCISADQASPKYGQIVRRTKNANTPFLLFNQKGLIPKVSSLSHYVKPEEQVLTLSKRSKQREVVNGYLNLVGVIKS